MIILGLTGSIGMGKTTTAKLFAEEGVPTYDADAAVHALYAPGGAGVEPVGAAFPGALREGRIDREELSRLVINDPVAMKKLEEIVHPLVRQEQIKFLKAQHAAGARVALLDIPLLYEGGGEQLVDAVVVVTATAEEQRRRVLARPGMSAEKLEALLAKQIPDEEKRKRADFVINTGFGMEDARAQVRAVLAALRDAA